MLVFLDNGSAVSYKGTNRSSVILIWDFRSLKKYFYFNYFLTEEVERTVKENER